MANGKAKSDMDASHFDALAGDAETPDQSDYSEFINSGLRAARSCRNMTRSAILADVAAVLSCSADELSFMFNDGTNVHRLHDRPANGRDGLAVPDFREMLQGMAAE